MGREMKKGRWRKNERKREREKRNKILSDDKLKTCCWDELILRIIIIIITIITYIKYT